MPVNKNALLRYRIIDGCLTNPMRRYPTMDYILDKIEDQLGERVSDSQFAKDIQGLKRIYKAPIKFDRQHNGYCYTEPDFSIREFPLTHAEIEALDYSTALLQQLKGTRMFQQFENAINKMTEGYRVSQLIGKSEVQILQVEEPVKTEGSQWLEFLLKCVVEKTAVAMRYRGYGKEQKQYILSPYLLKEYRNRWYVIGHAAESGGVRVFALDRIVSLSQAKAAYKHSEFSPDEFFRYSFGITHLDAARPEKVKLKFKASEIPYVLSQPLHHSQQVASQDENQLTVTMHVYITSELKMAILAHGAAVEVLAPESLRKEIADIAAAMASQYR